MNCGDCGDDLAAAPEVSDRTCRFGKSPLSQFPGPLSQNHSQSPISFRPDRELPIGLYHPKWAGCEIAGILARAIFRALVRRPNARRFSNFDQAVTGCDRSASYGDDGPARDVLVDMRARRRLCCACRVRVWTGGGGAGKNSRCSANFRLAAAAHENLLPSLLHLVERPDLRHPALDVRSMASWSARTSSATAITGPGAARSIRRC